ncbi:MAG TPA: trehalose-phosphatase [Nocardioidaceae bacterium]|jgi:trehalose 6-phosphate phosphatase|nr:trehalose-phosphatase [Nocardioidaceae bacterium]
MDFRTPEGQQRYDGLVARAHETVVALDFDGVLSPIVDDPTRATIHPDAPAVLVELAAQVRAIAVITGRPARQAIALGDLDEVGGTITEQGGELFLLGQYGNERWSSRSRRVVSPRPPEGLASFMSGLPQLLGRHDAADAFVEEKGIAVAVHTRRLPDAAAAFDRLLPVLTDAAERHGLTVEPGRMVVEVRAPGMHKGQALRAIRGEVGATGVLYAGDDLGDIEAFNAVQDIRDSDGVPGLLVCSGSEEQQALVELSDIVVDGPEGVLALLRQFAADAAAHAPAAAGPTG